MPEVGAERRFMVGDGRAVAMSRFNDLLHGDVRTLSAALDFGEPLTEEEIRAALANLARQLVRHERKIYPIPGTGPR